MSHMDIKEVFFWGGTGQAKVLRPILEHNNIRIIAVFDKQEGLSSPFADVDIFYGIDEYKRWSKHKKRSKIGFCVAIGNPHGIDRLFYHALFVEDGFVPMTIVHPSAVIEKNVHLGAGCQILAGAIIGSEVKIGEECIINTGAVVDHECILEEAVGIAPRASLCGLVYCAKNAWICAGAVVIPRIQIGENAVVGAGAVVLEDVLPNSLVVGNPARLVRRNV